MPTPENLRAPRLSALLTVSQWTPPNHVHRDYNVFSRPVPTARYRQGIFILPRAHEKELDGRITCVQDCKLEELDVQDARRTSTSVDQA